MEEHPETEYVEKQGSMNKRIIFHKKKRHRPTQIILYSHTKSRCNNVALQICGTCGTRKLKDRCRT